MCRFLLYLGEPVTLSSLITEPANSLIRQSFQAKERFEPLNGDGFGIAWYVPHIDGQPALFKSITPAWNNRNLQHVARLTRSSCILAHVRAATSSQSVTELNCHPFAWREIAFCHNGDIGGFQHIRRQLLASLGDEAFRLVQGNTDSEHFFALFIDRFVKNGGDEKGADRTAIMANTLVQCMHEIVAMVRLAGLNEPCYMNFAVTDGHRAVVSHCSNDPKYSDSLYLFAGHQYACVKGATRMIRRNVDMPAMVLVASEPLTSDSHWHRVGLNTVVVIDENLAATSRDVKFEELPSSATGKLPAEMPATP